jgi:hypothetical protein
MVKTAKAMVKGKGMNLDVDVLVNVVIIVVFVVVVFAVVVFAVVLLAELDIQTPFTDVVLPEQELLHTPPSFT